METSARVNVFQSECKERNEKGLQRVQTRGPTPVRFANTSPVSVRQKVIRSRMSFVCRSDKELSTSHGKQHGAAYIACQTSVQLGVVPLEVLFIALPRLNLVACVRAVLTGECQAYPPRIAKKSGGRQTKTIVYLGWRTAPLPAAPDPNRTPIQFHQSSQRSPSPRPGLPHSRVLPTISPD